MFLETSLLLLLALDPAIASSRFLLGWPNSGRRSDMCDVKGQANSDNHFFYSESKKLASYDGCSARCTDDDRCKSFGFDDRACLLFDEPLAGNFHANKQSDFVYYDVGCVENADSSASPLLPATQATGITATGTRLTKTATGAGSGTTGNTKGSDVGLASILSTPASDEITGGGNGGAAALSSADDGARGNGSAPSTTATDLPGAGPTALVSVVNATSIGGGLVNLTTANSDNSPAPTAAVGDLVIASANSSSNTDIPSADDDSGVHPSSNLTVEAVSSTNSSNGVFENTNSSSAAISAGCDVPQSFTITSFFWFNSSQNLDCVNANYPNSSKVCWDEQNKICDPATAASQGCTCAPYCSTGVPLTAYQPLGFGAPDSVSITFGGMANGTCQQSNPQSANRAEVGDGSVDCGGSSNILDFYGDSNSDTSTGSIGLYPPAVSCNGTAAVYSATFPLLCSRDEGNNATCTAPTPLTLNLTAFDV